MKHNQHIRLRIQENYLFGWMVAAEAGISDATLCRWLRFPLNEEREARINAAINACIEKYNRKEKA